MIERSSLSLNWKKYHDIAKQRIGKDPHNSLWDNIYAWQITFTELELRNLGVKHDISPENIPNINKIHNLDPIDPKKELGLVEIIGMPGAGKDTLINAVSTQNLENVVCAKEEGYWWSHKESPLTSLNKRHFQAYGGTDMEIDEVVDKLSFRSEKPIGIGILNRSIRDNFLAFGYSFFLSGFISIRDLILSQKIFHYYQYSPTLEQGNLILEDITAGTVICMIRPEVSLKRIPRRGRILEPNFLNILYTQYLRMTSKLQTIGQRNFVVLDMTGSIEENTQLFWKTLEKMIKIS